MTGITRRRIIAVGGVVAIGAGYSFARKFAGHFTPPPEFEPISDPAGFRRVSGGSSSLGANPFAGLDGTSEESSGLPVTEVRDSICTALYGEEPLAPGTVPVASFSDFYCPYCRVQTKELARLEDRMGDKIRVAWHELPLLGEASLLASRAALAAKRQGAYVRFQERLISTPFRANPGYLKALSEEIGISYSRLTADMSSDDVGHDIQVSAALADIFGFVGTPALVIGRTVIQGQVGAATLKRIIELERADGWSQVC
ncbi:thioredoxin domain-containing protein [Aquicoccus sp. SCR17]|jgi:predicted DsbA family dithiol-disulfide isomerase|nr:thioredoxin domain-containing protein [Carideicomes alvinocaridis]